MTGDDLAQAAEKFAGAPFRLHGRDPQTGLDCIGLLEAAFTACGMDARLPTGYSLRTGWWQDLESHAARLGFVPCKAPVSPGDIFLLRPSPVQMHFAIASTAPGLMVEAHAGLRKVVISPVPDVSVFAWHWRLALDK
jgi:cell wall-associated NlpC family hydrolase